MSTGLALPVGPTPADPPATLAIQPWPDGVIDALGHDPRSHYVEQYWLGILGPSTTWLLRRLAAGLEASPEGFDLPLADTAQALVSGCTVTSALIRAVASASRARNLQPLHSSRPAGVQISPLHSKFCSRCIPAGRVGGLTRADSHPQVQATAGAKTVQRSPRSLLDHRPPRAEATTSAGAG